MTVAPKKNAISARPEREETDESLRDEREKTDRELAERASKIHRDADAVLETARARADERLDSERIKGDASLEAAHVSEKVLDTVATEREGEDGALAEERQVASEKLDLEREARTNALREILRLEREETDRGLELERAQADEDLASRDDFLAMVAHDLRNLLGGVALSASLVLRNSAEDATREEASRIRRFTARMNRLVSDLVDVVSIDAGKLRLDVQPNDAAAVVRDTVDSYRAAATAKGLTLRAVGDGPSAGRFDRQRIEQVVANLVGNAMKFTPAGGTIEVAAKVDDEQLEVSVLDDGVGIPAEKAAKIFERFYQSAHHDHRGLGLGLYIAHEIVAAHAGRIWFEPRASGGSAFHFTLPVGRAADSSAAFATADVEASKLDVGA